MIKRMLCYHNKELRREVKRRATQHEGRVEVRRGECRGAKQSEWRGENETSGCRYCLGKRTRPTQHTSLCASTPCPSLPFPSYCAHCKIGLKLSPPTCISNSSICKYSVTQRSVPYTSPLLTAVCTSCSLF